MLRTSAHHTKMRVAIAQLNLLVGDVSGNGKRIEEAMRWADAEGADMLVTPELALCGYPPEDLIGRADFVEAQCAELARLVELSADLEVSTLIGFIEPAPETRVLDAVGRRLFNSMALVEHGEVTGLAHKQLLPGYGIFDEQRWVRPGSETSVFDIKGRRVGVLICEDFWDETAVNSALDAEADLLVVANASPWWRGKRHDRWTQARHHGDIVYVNQVGGQDGIVFDGSSFVMVEDRLVYEAPAFAEALDVVEVGRAGGGYRIGMDPDDERAMTWAALTCGIRDYVNKNGFSSVWLGLSGGIDSAVSATLAVDALAPERVHGVLLPSGVSSDGSVTDALALADRLGIDTITLPIGPIMDTTLDTLHGRIALPGTGRPDAPFAGTEVDVAEQNLQARIRGMLLMALSNKHGGIVVTTGNRSEISVGYTTLYGDSVGGFGALSDVAKTLVYELAHWRNALGADDVDALAGGVSPIPEASITKPPSAELAPGQLDADNLPDYDLLDAILELYVEGDRSPEQVVNALRSFLHYPNLQHYSRDDLEVVVARVMSMVAKAEYKRRQMAPGVKITSKAFGRDRRMPITTGWRG